MDGRKILLIYLIFINIAAFLIFGWDKMQAKKRRWRVAEKTLFMSVILGGGIGAMAGMKLWRHKTRKWYFKFGVPLLVILQVSAAIYTTFFMK